MKVRDVMKSAAASCTPVTDLAQVGRIMAEVGCGMLPVIDVDERVVGVLTDRDLALAVTARDVKPDKLVAREVMTEEVARCRTGDELGSALARMRARRVRRLPVVDGEDRLVGILSLDDVVLEVGPETSAGRVSYEELALTIKAINEHPVPALAG